MAENIGIIAGGGQFPRLIAQDARNAGLGVVICGFQGHTDAATAEAADIYEELHLGQLNRMVGFFRGHGGTRVCMARSLSKPRALDFRPDWRAADSAWAQKAGLYEGEVFDRRESINWLKSAKVNDEFRGELRPATAKIALREDLTRPDRR